MPLRSLKFKIGAGEFTIREFQKNDRFLHEKNEKTLASYIPSIIRPKSWDTNYRTTTLCEPFPFLIWDYWEAKDSGTLFKPDHLTLVLLNKESKIIGVAFFHYVKQKKFIKLHAFCVDQEFRGKKKGITDKFLQESLVMSKRKFNSKNIVLLSTKWGKSLYKRHGFIELGKDLDSLDVNLLKFFEFEFTRKSKVRREWLSNYAIQRNIYEETKHGPMILGAYYF